MPYDYFARLLRMQRVPIAIVAVALVHFVAHADSELTLKKKAEVFEADMQRRFVIDGQLIPKLRQVELVNGVRSYNMPDNAYMTGLYTGILAMKYAATKDDATRAQGSQALDALHLLCTASGKPGLLARAVVSPDIAKLDDGDWQPAADGKNVWRTDVSSDQMDGVFYGFMIAYDLFANDEEKKQIAEDVSALMDRLIANEYRIIDYNGQRTEWGNYTEEYVTKAEPMNGLILLQHLKVAHHITGEEKYAVEYERFAKEKRYAELCVNAYQWRGARHNYSDDVLLWLAYYPLLALEKDPALLEQYKFSLSRAWNGVGERGTGINVQANPLFAFLAAKFLDINSGVAAAVQTLEWFPLELKWNRATIDAYAKEFGFTHSPATKSPAPALGEAVPVDRRVKQWSVWVHTPFEAGDNDTDIGGEYNGHDYLMGYWLGRYLGYI
ncbi:MAG: hypothetical protein SGI88_20555 [Candidatus Hydrogenedentes bacterium]|nr:hypothetical protein [Candidatus Hydrogenedentota bacterium]